MFKRGDWALLIDDSGFETVVRAGAGVVQTIRGQVDTDLLVGKPHGSAVTSSIGVRLAALPATIFDVIDHKFKVRAQVIRPKDAVYIVKTLAVGSGSRVAEAGTGSGFLTAVLAWYVKPWGVVYSFEKRLDHLRIAVRNIKSVGLESYVDIQLRDVATSGFGLVGLDAVVLDMGDPWNAIENAVAALKCGGRLAVFSTTVEHVQKTLTALKRHGVVHISIEEVHIRKWKPTLGELRPGSFEAHAGWIVSGRKR